MGSATAMHNAGVGPPNAPPANAPGPAHIQPPAPAAGSYQNPPPQWNLQGSIQLPLPASGNPALSGSAEQNVPPLGMRPLIFSLLSECALNVLHQESSLHQAQSIFSMPYVTLCQQPEAANHFVCPCIFNQFIHSRTNGPPEHSKTSITQGKVSKLPLLSFEDNINNSLDLRCPAQQPRISEVQRQIRRGTLTCLGPVTRQKRDHKQ